MPHGAHTNAVRCSAIGASFLFGAAISFFIAGLSQNVCVALVVMHLFLLSFALLMFVMILYSAFLFRVW